MDIYGDHALVCSCNGDRTVRHNALRNEVYQELVTAGVRPEREKAGLLPGRPAEDGIPVAASARRPADIWMRRGAQGNAQALDFAVTSGLRSDHYWQVLDDPGRVFADYEAFKRDYKQTDQICRDQGLLFTPMILEAHGGGWSPTCRGIVDWIARQIAAVTHKDQSVVSLRIAQRISCSLQRENARAIMRRFADPVEIGADTGWANLEDVESW